VNVRLALPPVAAALLVCVPGAGSGPVAAAPAPLPTRPTDEVCDAWSVAQQLCDAAATAVSGRYTCYAGVDMAASYEPDPGVPGLGLWTADAYGFHGCPDRSGDVVRVVGAMEALFYDEPMVAAACGDLGSCQTRASTTVYGFRYTTGVAVATTTTYDDVSATATAEEYFWWLT
jgi:hypothetical protein